MHFDEEFDAEKMVAIDNMGDSEPSELDIVI